MDEHEIFSILDIARELRELYQKNKNKVVRGKKGQLWNSLCRALYNTHGSRLGYSGEEDFHIFKSFVKRAQLSLRKVELREKLGLFLGENEIKKSLLEDDFARGEGSTTFTQWQIKYLGLNPDTY